MIIILLRISDKPKNTGECIDRNIGSNHEDEETSLNHSWNSEKVWSLNFKQHITLILWCQEISYISFEEKKKNLKNTKNFFILTGIMPSNGWLKKKFKRERGLLTSSKGEDNILVSGN